MGSVATEAKVMKRNRVMNFLKTVPGIITGVVAAVTAITGVFMWAAAAATSPLAERVDNLEQRQENNISNIQKNSELVSKTRDELMAEILKIRIADMIERDYGTGDRREFIMATYDELLRVCGDCPSTKYEIERYLASL